MASDFKFNYLSLDTTERYEDLGITTEDFITYQKFFIPNSNLKKYFRDNVSSVIDYDKTTANINHAIQHVTVDPVPYVNQFQPISGSHHGLMRHEDKEILDNLYTILTGGSDSKTSIGSTLIGDSDKDFLVKIHQRMFIGGSDEELPDFNDDDLWDKTLVPELGLYVRGLIRTGAGIETPAIDVSGNLTVGGELWVGDVQVKPSSIIPNSITLNEDGNIFANQIYGENFHTGLIKIHDHYIDHVGDPVNDFIITRINDSLGGGTTNKNFNALVISENLSAPKEGGKVFINVPKENNQNVTWYPYLTNVHPTDSTLWVGGKTTIGFPGNTIATLNLHSGGIISHEHTTFEILHGFHSWMAPHYPSMKIDATGGLKLQSDPDIASWAELQIGSLNNKVGQKLFGQLRINATTIMPSVPLNAVGEYALAFVTEGASGESITGVPIAIRNDSFVGIGTLPGPKRLTVHGGADFINYSESSDHVSILTASTFENPGNVIDLTYPPSTNGYYSNNGTLLLKGTNQFEEDKDTIGYKYDLRLSGNKSAFININNTVEHNGKYWGARIDGRLHLYDNDDDIYLSMDDSGIEFLKNAGITLLNGDFKTSKGDFITDEGDFNSLKGDFIAQEGDFVLSNGSLRIFDGQIFLNSYTGNSTSGRFGVDTDGNFKGLSFIIPGHINLLHPSVLFGIDASGNANLTDLNIYGDFAFKGKTSLDLFGGDLLNIHDIKGSIDSLSDGGDGKYGNITGFHQIESKSNVIDSTPEKTSLITGFYTIKGGSAYIDETVVGDNLLIGRITGFPYIIGNRDHNGIIKQFKDIEGNFNKLDFGDASKAGDIKYYKNIIGFDFTNKNSIPFTIPNPSYVDAETTPNIPQTIINPIYPPYEGGSVQYFKNIEGISDLYHQGNIKDFDEIHTQSAVFAKSESFIYSSLFEIGERNDPTQAIQQLNADLRTILFKGGSQNSKTHFPVSFQFHPNIINNPIYSEENNTVPEYLMRSYFSLHHSNDSGIMFFPDEEYSDSSYLDLKVRHIWLDGEEVLISAGEMNALSANGVLFTDGTNAMLANLNISGNNITDVNEIQVDFIKNRNTTINDIRISPNEGDDTYSIGRTIIGETKNKNTLIISSFNDDGIFSSDLKNLDGSLIHPGIVDNRSFIIPGIEETPTRLSLMYRDYNGAIQQGISINPDGTVTLPDNPLGFALSGELGFMPVGPGKVHLGLLDVLGLTLDSLNSENTLLGTLIISPSTEDGEPSLSFNTITEGTGTVEDPEFKFIELATVGSLLFKTASDQKIKFETSIVEIAEPGELYFNEKSKIWYDYSSNNFNFGNYILNPLNTNFLDDDDDLSTPKVWKEGISIFYDQVGSYNETYDFNSLRVGIGTTEAYKKAGLKTYSNVGDNVILLYGKASSPSQFLSDYDQRNVIISYENVGNKDDYPEIKKGSLISLEGIDYQIQIITHIDDTYSIVNLNQSLPSAPPPETVNDPGSPLITIAHWQHKFTDIATLTVNGLLKADNIDLSSGFSGQALFDQIEVGVDSYLDKAFLKVGKYDANSSLSGEAFIIGAGDEPDTDRDLILVSKNGDIMFGDGYVRNFLFNNDSRIIFGYNENDDWTFQLGDSDSSGVLALYDSNNSLGVYLTGDDNDNFISNNSFDIKSHDRELEKGLKLSGQLVESSALELNYLSEVVAGTATFGKALVIDSNGSIDALNTSELKLNSVTLTASAEELNTLTNINLSTDFTLIYKYLVGVQEGIPLASKAVVMDAYNQLNSLEVSNLTTSKISNVTNNVFIDSPISISSNFLKTELNLDGLMTFKENSGSYTPTDLDVGYISLYAKDKDLYVKYYDDTKVDPIIIKNITAHSASFIRYDNGNNVYYKEGNVGIFNKNDTVLNAQEKLHLADGNLLLQKPIQQNHNLSSPPGIIISESSTTKSFSDLQRITFGMIVSDIEDNKSSYWSFQNTGLKMTVDKDVEISSKDKLMIEGEDEVSIYSKGNLLLQPSTDMSFTSGITGSPQHGDLIIYDQTYDFIPYPVVETSVGQIAIGHPDPTYWLDIRQMQHIADRQQYVEADGAVNVDPYMVNIQKGEGIQLELLKNSGQIINATTSITGTSRVIDIKTTEDNSYLTLIGSKKLGIDDNLPTQTFTGRGNLKLWGNKPTVFLGQEDSWFENTDATGYMTNDFRQQTSSINFLGASEAIFETGTTPHNFPNYRHYGGISEITFNNDLNQTQFTPFNSAGSTEATEDVIFNQYIDFRFLRLNEVDLDTNDPDSRLTKSADLLDEDPPVANTAQHQYTIDDSGGYFRAMIIDGRTESVGIGQHFKRGDNPIANAGQPTAKLDIQGNLNLTAELHEPGETIPASAIVLDDTQTVNALDAIDGVALTPSGTPATSDNNYGYGYYKGSMGEISIHTEHPDILAEPPVGGDGFTDYTHQPWGSSSVNSNNLDIPSGLKDDGVNTWNEYGYEGGYKYDYIENVRISPLRHSFIKSHGNFGIGTITPASKLHITNSTLFKDGDVDFKVDFTDIGDIEYLATLKSTKRLFITSDTDDVALTNGTLTSNLDNQLGFIGVGVGNTGTVTINTNFLKNYATDDISYTNSESNGGADINEVIYQDLNLRFDKSRYVGKIDIRGTLSSNYTTTNKLFDYHGLTVEMPNTTMPVMRYLPKKIRTGEDIGYITVNKEDPLPKGVPVSIVIAYDETGSTASSVNDPELPGTANDPNHKIYLTSHYKDGLVMTVNETNSKYILLELENDDPETNERKWLYLYPRVEPERNDFLTIYDATTNELIQIESIEFTGNSVSTYDTEINTDKYEVELKDEWQTIDYDTRITSWDMVLDWDRQRLYHFSVDGYISDSNTTGEDWVTLDPSQGHALYIRDKDGNGTHKVLTRSTLDDNIVLNTLLHTEDELNEISIDSSEMIHSNFVIGTYHYDFQNIDWNGSVGDGSIKTDGSNVSGQVKRLEFTDSIDAFFGTQPGTANYIDSKSDLKIYTDVYIGNHLDPATTEKLYDGTQSLKLFGNFDLYDSPDTWVEGTTTSQLNADMSGNLTIQGNFDASASGWGKFGSYVNVGTNLDVGGHVTFDDDIFEINRVLDGEVKTTTPTDIPLSGFLVNRGEASAGVDNSKSAFLWSEGTATGTDLEKSNQFVLLNNHVDFIYDSQYILDATHPQQRSFEGLVVTSLNTNKTYKIKLYVTGDDFSNVASTGITDDGATGDIFTPNLDTTPDVWSNGSIVVDTLDFSSYISDFRANDIYTKTLYLPNHHGVTNTNYSMLPTLADDYYKLEASGHELNKLHEVFDTVDANQFNALHGLNIDVLVYPTHPDYGTGNGFYEGEKKTIQWHIHDLNKRKVEMVDYFTGEPENLLIHDPKGLKPLDDTPFYIRTKRNNFTNQHKDQFLAITKLDGYSSNEGNTALTDDFLGGALYYDSTTEVTSALDETYKSGDFIIGGYPYRPTTNHGEQQNTTVDGSGNPYTGSGTEFLNTNYDPRTHVFYAPDILLQPTKFDLYEVESGQWQDTLETSGGNVGIGVETANYKLHVENVNHANATGEEQNWNGTIDIENVSGSNGENLLTDDYYRPVVAFFGKNSFDINRRQPGLTGFPAQNGSVRLRMSPRPDFDFDNFFGHERDTNVAEFELNAYEAVGIQQGSLGDFNIRNYFSKPTGTGGDINLITAKIPTIAGSQATFEDGITASFGGLRTHGHMGVGGSSDLGAILKIYGKSSKGGGTSPDDASGSGFNSNTESLRLNSSIMFENPTFVNSSGETIPVHQKYFFLNDGGELQIADSISNLGEPSGISMEMRTTEIGVAKNIVPTFTAEISRILKVDTHVFLDTPVSGRIYLNDDVSNTPVNIQPQDFSIVEVTDDPNTINQGHPTPPGYARIRILTSQITTPVIKGSKFQLTPQDPEDEYKPFPPFITVIDSYTDLADPTKHIIVVDFKPLTETQDGTPIALPPVGDWRVGWNSVLPTGSTVSFTHGTKTFSNKVKAIVTGRQYDRDIAGGGNIIEIPGSVIVTQDQIGTGDLLRVMTVSDPTDSVGGTWYFNGVGYPSRLNLTQYNHGEFNQLSIPRPQLPSEVSDNYIFVQIDIVTAHTNLHDGTQGVDNTNIASSAYDTLAFWNGRTGQNTNANKGTYRWKRTWIEGVDDASIKESGFDPNNPMTEWEENVDYDIFDDYTDTDTIDDFSNFDAYNNSSLNAHGLQKLGKSGGNITSTLAGNGDLNLFIRFLPIDLAQGHNWEFLLFPEQSIFKSAVISLGTTATPISELSTDGDSFHLGTSHLQDSRLNKGGFRVASSSIEMVKREEPIQTWTTPIVDEVPAEDPTNPYVGIFAPFDAGSIFVAKNEASDEQERLWYMPPREGTEASSGEISYTESYQAPIDLLAGSGGSADLSNITMDLIPSEDADYNDPTKGYDIGSIDFDDPTTEGVVESLTRSFRDIFIKGDYKYWNPNTNQFDTLNSATVPFSESFLNITPKISSYTVDESYFTVLNEAFDSINHIEFVRVRFDYDPHTGKEVPTDLDTDNIYETHDIVVDKNLFTIELMEEGIGFESNTSTDIDTSGYGTDPPVWVDLETLFSSPDLDDVWTPTDQLGNPISPGHFIANPEEIILWSNIKLPYDFDHWDSSNPLSIKLRALDKANVKVTITAFDTSKVKTHELVKDVNTLTNDWLTYNLSELNAGTWSQGSEISFKILIELKDPDSAIDISSVAFKYDTRYEYATLLPIVNFTSTTISTTQLDGETTLKETLFVEASDVTHTTAVVVPPPHDVGYDYQPGNTNGPGGTELPQTSTQPALVVDGDIIPAIPFGASLGTAQHPFKNLTVSSETIFIGGQKSIAWGVIGESNDIGYNKGSVGIGNVNPTESLEVTGNAKIVGNVSATTFTETTSSGTSSDWNTAFTHSQDASGNPHAISIDNLTDTTITSIGDNQILTYEAGSTNKWINKSYAQGEADIATVTALNAHKNDTGDPHFVTKAQVGLGSVDDVSLYNWSQAIDRDLIPDGDKTRSLGSPTKQWKDLHISDATLFVGGEVQTGWKADTVSRGEPGSEIDYTDIKFTKGWVGVGLAVPTTEFEVSGVSTLGGDVNITGSGNLVVAGTLTGTGYNDTQWNTAYTHSLIAGGDSVHVSTTENTQWDSAYTHSQIAGGNSVHVSTEENTQWDTAYTHSQVSGGIHNTGTVTSIIAGSGLAGGTITTSGTISHADTSTQGSLTALTGANIVSDVDLDTYGHVTNLATRALTLANLGFTGDNNANYITNNNELTNGAGYELANQKGVASGYASLDSNSKIPTSQMPNLALTDVNVVATQALQLALTVQEGDVAIRSDLAKSYIALNSDNVDMADWAELLSPASPVQSVNSQTGNIVLTTSDIAEGSNLYYTNARVETKVVDLLKEGTGITLTHDSGNNELTISGSALYTDDDAQDAVASMIQDASGITWTHVDNNNGLSTLTPVLAPVAGTITGNLAVIGEFSATTKSFDIEHPTKEGKRLIHGSLEGAEHGVYVRGKLEGNDEIELPDYWKELVDEDSITVQLTAIGNKQDLWVKDVTNNRVFIGSSTNQVKCFYFIQAERKDVEKLTVEV